MQDPTAKGTRRPELPLEEKRNIVEAITERITIADAEVEISLSYAPTIPKRKTYGVGGSSRNGGGNGGIPPLDHGKMAAQLA